MSLELSSPHQQLHWKKQKTKYGVSYKKHTIITYRCAIFAE